MKAQIRKILDAQGRGWSYLYLRLGQKSGSTFYKTLEEKTIRLKTIEKIALVLNVPISDLFVEIEKPIE
jgi:hypothetical protein